MLIEMSCLIWNCCGLGNSCIENELADIMRAKDPSVMFIAETWANETRLKDVKRKTQFENMFVVPRTNRGGSLVLFWRSSIGVIVRDSRGMAMVSLSHNIPLPHSVVDLETLAASRALDFSLEIGLDKAVLEGDSEIEMNALKDDFSSLASFGLLILDAQMLAGLFSCISFLHLGRDGNSVAHNLARHV